MRYSMVTCHVRVHPFIISETFVFLLCSPITHPSRESGISLSDAMGTEVHGWMWGVETSLLNQSRGSGPSVFLWA
jgi:hypothetical protein